MICLIHHNAGLKNISNIRFNLIGSKIQSIPSFNGRTVQPNLYQRQNLADCYYVSQGNDTGLNSNNYVYRNHRPEHRTIM